MIFDAERSAVTNDPQIAIVSIVIVLENYVSVDLFRHPHQAVITAQLRKGVTPVSANEIRYFVNRIFGNSFWDGARITLVIMGVARKNSMRPAFCILAAGIDFGQHNGAAAMLRAIGVRRMMNGEQDTFSRILETAELGGEESELLI